MNRQEHRNYTNEIFGGSEEQVSYNAWNESNEEGQARDNTRQTSTRRDRESLFQGRMLVEESERAQTDQMSAEPDKKLSGRRRKSHYLQHQTPRLKSGHWSTEEKIKYYQFIVEQQERFEKKELRRIDKVFKLMSQTIQTRAPDQCRSHHQKMQKKYGGFKNLLEKFCTDYEDKSRTVTDKTPIDKVQLLEKQIQESKASTPGDCDEPEAEGFSFNFEMIRLAFNNWSCQILEEPNFMHDDWVKRSFTEEFQDDARNGYLMPI